MFSALVSTVCAYYQIVFSSSSGTVFSLHLEWARRVRLTGTSLSKTRPLTTRDGRFSDCHYPSLFMQSVKVFS